jgi:hypothetical protein
MAVLTPTMAPNRRHLLDAIIFAHPRPVEVVFGDDHLVADVSSATWPGRSTECWRKSAGRTWRKRLDIYRSINVARWVSRLGLGESLIATDPPAGAICARRGG